MKLLVIVFFSICCLYLGFFLKYYYYSNSSLTYNILQIHGESFVPSILRERHVVVCNDWARHISDEVYSTIYSQLQSLEEQSMIEQDTSTVEMKDFFTQQQDKTIPSNTSVFYNVQPIYFPSLHKNWIMQYDTSLLHFSSSEAISPFFQSFYDHWCILLLEGDLHVKVVHWYEIYQHIPSSTKTKHHFFHEMDVETMNKSSCKYIQIDLHSNQMLFIPHGFAFQIMGGSSFNVALHLRWFSGLTYLKNFFY